MGVPTSDDHGAIAGVRPGMRVVDVSGDEVGTVQDVRMGDSGAVTAQGQDGGDGGLLAAVADAFGGGDDLPDAERERLLRLGYVRIDAAGIFAGDRYATTDEIAAVDGDVVRLSVTKDALAG